MESYKKKVITLISNLLLEYRADPTVVPHYPAKTEIMRRDRHPLPHGSPEAHGIPASSIISLLSALENEPSVNLHSIVITRDGVVIAEASAPGYDATLPHLSHSMSKTVTGMLIESLMDSGEVALGSRVIDFFPEITPRDERLYKLTVEHLLTMSSGVSFAEVGAVSGAEWIRDFFDSELVFAPGEEFLYNSMNSYVLMQIADRIAKKNGIDAAELLKRRIFEPMGIKNSYWERSPEGVPKGGWGLYLSCESWARLGIMMMQGGVYNGKRILSERAVNRATSVSVSVPRDVSPQLMSVVVWAYIILSKCLGSNRSNACMFFCAVGVKELTRDIYDSFAVPCHCKSGLGSNLCNNCCFEVFFCGEGEEFFYVFCFNSNSHSFLRFAYSELCTIKTFVFFGNCVKIDCKTVCNFTDSNRNTACTEVVASLDEKRSLGVTEKSLKLAFFGCITFLNLSTASFKRSCCVRFGGACCTTATIAACSAAEKDNYITGIRAFTSYVSLRSRADNSTDLHAFCRIAGVINFFTNSREGN